MLKKLCHPLTSDSYPTFVFIKCKLINEGCLRFEQKICHSCESRNPFLADAVFRELWIPAFAGMTEKNLNIEC
ncbi:Uncharacterized protein dnm_070190 [Desulfonema magnum]|uniref:Uncharacterized protein n=1 Tax=Desulfonema magnum TaxID=45655 RepID=A0A975BTN5_9BACT|nr:Uncharacterized protein dnm_070190 [Desulfonema magnum]